MSFFSDALKGLSWMGALVALIKLLAIVKIAVLARILAPSQFGDYGIALLVLGFLEVLTETGINIFLIQQKDEIINYLSSAWVVSIFRGILISLIILITSQVIIAFFKTPHIAPLLYLVSVVSFIRGFINPMIVSFQKRLEFKKVFIFQGSLYFLDAFAAVMIALKTHNSAAMLIGMIVAALTEVLLSFVLFKEKPKFILEKEKLMKVINSGKWVTGAGIFSYLFQNIDNITIGKVLGTSSLGLYQQSYSIATLPVAGVSDVFNKVMFPVFIKMSDDLKRLKVAYFKVTSLILVLSIIFSGTIYFFTDPIIRVFLGDKWLIIAPTLKILSIFAILKSILNSSYSLFLSLKKQKWVMLSELFGILAMSISIYPMIAKYGNTGAGYSAIIAVICSFPVVLINLRKIFNEQRI